MTCVLVTTDLGTRSDRAVMRAVRLATQMDLPLHILHVSDDDLPAALLQRRTEEAEATLIDMVKDRPELAALDPQIDVEVGEITKQISTIAARTRPCGARVPSRARPG